MAEIISVKRAAEIMGKGQQFVRIGLQRKLLPIGTAIKMGNRWNYYISPELFSKYVGVGKNQINEGDIQNG
ncbi:hypothetical protein [Anaerosinus massiliensis]|uniref:hypothetical protein n=1 Tax=Massilibacillus massiliensis TaxID=1806837 RepID=UPI000DA63549|nr:hypothetical protein [Massilibacillus massiliensis]